MDQFQFLAKDKLNNLPTKAGVYLFWLGREPIYIGKAINIKDRVKNHFMQPTYKDNFFTGVTEKIGFIETGSEIEALILEANLIKKYQPKYNQVWRDDKNYFYVAIASGRRLTQTKTQTHADKIPYIFITHQKKDIDTQYIGPFVEGTPLKKTLKFLRKVFAYYTTNKHPKRNCQWCNLGLCPGPLLFENPPNPEALAALLEYKKNIKKLILILQGQRKTVLFALKKEMAAFSAENKFEEALAVREKISALEQIMAHTNVIDSRNSNSKNQTINDEKWIKTEKLLQEILQVKTPISKIECFDISNIQGTLAVASMVVFVNGRPDKSQYKKFRIRMENKPNDIAMLGEVLARRLNHPEWGYPEVMLIDGGIAQLNIGIKSKTTYTTNPTAVDFVVYPKKPADIKIISIAKGKRELLIEGQKEHIPLKNLPQDVYNVIVALDDEAHRFAITYHKKLRSKHLLQ